MRQTFPLGNCVFSNILHSTHAPVGVVKSHTVNHFHSSTSAPLRSNAHFLPQSKRRQHRRRDNVSYFEVLTTARTTATALTVCCAPPNTYGSKVVCFIENTSATTPPPTHRNKGNLLQGTIHCHGTSYLVDFPPCLRRP